MERTVRQDLMRALGCNCECVYNDAAELVTVCPSHKAIAEDEDGFVHHMEFARLLKSKWIKGEGLPPAA